MRDKDRIDSFFNEFCDLWKKYFPDWRFGQLMLNFLGWGAEKYGDPFFWEEDKSLEYFKEYCEENSMFSKR